MKSKEPKMYQLVEGGNWRVRLYLRRDDGSYERIRRSLKTSNLDKARRETDLIVDRRRSQLLATSLRRRVELIERLYADKDEIIKQVIPEIIPKSRKSDQTLIDDFVQNKKVFDGTRRCDLMRYKSVLNTFLVYLNGKSFQSVTLKELEEFRDKLLAVPKIGWSRDPKMNPAAAGVERLSMASIRNIVTNIKTFYRYLAKKQIIDKNPAEGVEIPVVTAKRRRDPPPPEIAKRLRVIPPPESARFGHEEWYLFTELISRTGARIVEIGNLSRQDIFLSDDVPYVRVKNAKQENEFATKLLPIPSIVISRFKVFLSKTTNEHIFEGMGRLVKSDQYGEEIKCGQYQSKLWRPQARLLWPGMDMHSWRHYVGSEINRQFSQEMSCRVLGHSTGLHRVNEMYNHTKMIDKLKAIDAVP